MKISVVITLYNLEKFIDEALQSVFHQTRKADEIIVADDGSTDASPAIVGQYSNVVKHIRQPKNVGALRNSLAGLKAATGDIIAFLDGDDVWMPEKLEEIEKLFLADDAVVLASHDFVRVDESLNELGIVDVTNLNTQRIVSSLPKEEWNEAFRKSILLRKGFWLGSAYAVKREAINLAQFEGIVNEIGDYRLSYLDMTLGPYVVATNPKGKVGFVNKVLFKYRAHGSNSWQAFSKERAINNIKRWQDVNNSTFEIINRVVQNDEIKNHYTYLYDELELQRLQFENKKLSAVSKFVRLVPVLYREKTLYREFARLLVTTFFGTSFFLKLRTLKSKN